MPLEKLCESSRKCYRRCVFEQESPCKILKVWIQTPDTVTLSYLAFSVMTYKSSKVDRTDRVFGF